MFLLQLSHRSTKIPQVLVVNVKPCQQILMMMMMMTPPSRRSMSTTDISLTPTENLLRKCLLDCRNEMKSVVPGMADLELRFAGGWVRDKLLGKASNDIDVALSNMTGEQFGMALQQFMAERGQKYVDEAQAQGISAVITELHKIRRNPELSKHLETVTTKVFGLGIDLVNLRKEVYSEDSRTPKMEFGTPEEDALRRDATINSMFYHLDHQVVEDFTRRGLDDMEHKIIRTPLEAYQTFKDDPLRILRLIRFSSRLGYHIEPSVYEAMKDQRIHQALKLKISRQRLGDEVVKIMAGPDPYKGLLCIYDRGLFDVVFADPASQDNPDSSTIPRVYQCLLKMFQNQPTICRDLRLLDEPSLAWFLATYSPWHCSKSAAILAAREGVKAVNTFRKVLEGAIVNRGSILVVVNAICNEEGSRASVGVTLRNAGTSWRYHVLYSLLCDASKGNFETVLERYEHFLQYVCDQGLQDAATRKPVISGSQIRKILKIQDAGPWMKRATDLVVEWQFSNPTGSEQAAKDMIKCKEDELRHYQASLEITKKTS